MAYAKLYAKAVRRQALKLSEKPVEESLKESRRMEEEPRSKDELFKKALEEITRIYSLGLYPYLFEQQKELYRRLLGLVEKVEQAYLEGKVTVEAFRATLKEYWALHKEAIRIYEIDKQSKQNKQSLQDKFQI